MMTRAMLPLFVGVGLMGLWLAWGGGSDSATLAAAPEAAEADGREVRFNRDIRPILSDACFTCHGFDEAAREADLRLDREEDVFADRGDYAVVAPGDLEESELYWRITANQSVDQMPPPNHKRQLTDEEIALIGRWIEQGAEWEGHWSFVELGEPAVPAVDGPHADWARNPIDHFVLRRLGEEGLAPSAEADRRTLIRRLSMDLLGLPPTPEQVERFLSDDRPNAYERQVERLLASPHFGERMAMYWLDLVRFADTVGYHGDQPVNTWPYRDYVIDAFNANKPFDQFTREQLAGDLLPEPTQEQQIAAAYNRLGMMSSEGGGQDKEYFARYAADRVRNTSAVWMGTTLACAECHDHKYDPFSIEDFYNFAAFFADIKEQGIYSRRDLPDGSLGWGEMMRVPQPKHERKLAELDAQLAELREALEREGRRLGKAQREWEQTALEQEVGWIPAEPESVTSAGGASVQVLDDQSILAGGERPEKETYTVTFKVPIETVTALRLETLPHESLSEDGPGRAGNGNFVLNGFVAYQGGSDGGDPVELANPSATHEQVSDNFSRDWTVAKAVDGDHGRNSGWAILPEVGQRQEAVFETVKDLHLGDDGRITVKLIHNYDKHSIGRFRLAVTDGDRPIRAGERAGLPAEIATILRTPADDRSAKQQQTLAEHFRSIAPELAPWRERIAQAEQEREQVDQSVPWMVATVTRDEPRQVRVLPRGDWTDDSGAVVEPAVPHFLPQPEQGEGERLDRLDLAEWLVSEQNPLTSRVFVNRLWAMYFNNGLSGTLEDVGSQGELPSHPDLLDYLASTFIDSGWDVKQMVRLIVTSSTYRQTSASDSHLDDVDPSNRLLARQSRFRISAELLRDNALRISGLLEPIIGGRSVKPYQPPDYYAQLNFPKRKYKQDSGANLWRRGVYTHWQRQYLHPSLMAFDAPSREACTAERPQSNTPLQALVLLNDPIYVESARVFAERILREAEGDDVSTRLAFAFRHALSREPEQDERDLLAALHKKHLAQYRDDPEAAAKLVSVGEREAAAQLDPVEVATWTSIARVILNLHETVTRY